MNNQSSAPTSRRVRIGLVVIGLPNLVTGLWAVLAPSGWFDNFPGWDPRLVAADPPFNSHLATDAGSGLLASGLVVLAAAWLADRRSTQLALVAFLAFALPHGAFHALHESPGLTSAENAQNAVLLGSTVVLAVVLLFASRGAAADEPSTAAA